MVWTWDRRKAEANLAKHGIPFELAELVFDGPLHLSEPMRDEDIDLSDMPEKLDWSNAERGKFYRPVKQQLTLRLDSDVVHWFKARGGGYQTRINQALRRFIEDQSRKAG